jgi:plastocyanin
MNKKWIALFTLLGLMLLLAAGCSKKEETSSEEAGKPAETAAAPAGMPVDAATVATVTGTVSFAGTAPAAKKIDMSQDPMCKGSNETQNLAVSNGKLANVFVYVKTGAEKYSFPAPTEHAKLDQAGCRYTPHVMGVMTGQTIEIINSDNTTHNIHPTPKDNREWNKSQPPQSAPITDSFAREEIMLPVKCNQHPWMKMYINVVKTPLFAVTGPDGKFEIKGLPPGTYTIAAVQEGLGEQTMQVTVGPKESKSVDFSFKPSGQ